MSASLPSPQRRLVIALVLPVLFAMSSAVPTGAFADVAPVVTAPAIASGGENTLITFLVLASDPDGDAIQSLTGSPLPAGAAFTTNATNTAGTFSWTPTFTQSGTYSVTFTASNSLTGSATTSICVCFGDRGPVVTAPATIASPSNVLITFRVTAADPDGEAIVSLTASPLPSGATFTANASNTSGTFAWTPTNAQTGTFSVTFYASNSLTGSATTVIVAGIGDRAPIVSAPASIRGEPDVPLSFVVSAVDPDGAAITALTAAPLPAGATFVTNEGNTSGTFAWTPTSSQVGVHVVTFTASNTLADQASTSIQVGSLLQARAFTSHGNRLIRLASGRSHWCASVEPVGGFFRITDIDPNSVVLESPGTGSVSLIHAVLDKRVVVGDADRNEIEDATFCFSKEDLRLLFSGVNGRTTVQVTVAGLLASGLGFRAPLTVDVIGTEGALAASVFPNPLNPAGMLSFTTTAPGRASVRLFDASGRLVRTLEPSAAAREHHVRIDGRDDLGRPLATGIYFYRIQAADGTTRSGRFSILR